MNENKNILENINDVLGGKRTIEFGISFVSVAYIAAGALLAGILLIIISKKIIR